MWRLRLFWALWGLRSMCCVRWTSLVGCRAASSNVCLSAVGQAAVAAAEAAAQRRRPCRNALHEIGAAAECGVQYAPHEIGAAAECGDAGHKIGAAAEYGVQCVGPIARSPDDANPGDKTRPAVVRAGIDPGLRSRNDGRGDDRRDLSTSASAPVSSSGHLMAGKSQKADPPLLRSIHPCGAPASPRKTAPTISTTLFASPLGWRVLIAMAFSGASRARRQSL